MAREIRDISKWSKKHAAREKRCAICGAKIPSFCKSHSIPEFVLRNISSSGYVFKTTPTGNPFIQCVEKSQKGIESAGVFFDICRACDNEWFCGYENPSILKNFLSLPADKQQELLAQMFLKNALKDYYRALGGSEFYGETERAINRFSREIGSDTATDLFSAAHFAAIDLKDQKVLIEESLELLRNKKHGFRIVHCEFVNRNHPVAFQLTFAPRALFSEQVINDVYDEAAELHYLALSFLPLGDGTLEIAFCRECDYSALSEIVAYFEGAKRVKREKLMLAMALAYSDDVFLTKEAFELLMENDRAKSFCNMNISRDEMVNGPFIVQYSETPNLSHFNQLPNIFE